MAKERLISLDVFEDFVLLMTIVNNQVTGPPYPPLEHADWNGWTPTDLVFLFYFHHGGSNPFALHSKPLMELLSLNTSALFG
jgi:predicted acyltransferase